MVKMELSAILYSKKNYDLGYKVHNICRAFSINLITALDFVELTIKSMELKPQIIFCDCETVDFSSSIINAFMEKTEFKNVKVVFIGSSNLTSCLNNFVTKNLLISTIEALHGLLTDIQSDIEFESIETKLKDKAFCDIDMEINKLLADLGFSLKYSGCAYLKFGIRNVVANNGIVHSLSSNEYPYIASFFKTGSANVERNIRNAIDKAWKTFGKEHWESIFYSKWIENGKKPTNREFIYMCAEILMSKFQKKVANIYY